MRTTLSLLSLLACLWSTAQVDYNIYGLHFQNSTLQLAKADVNTGGLTLLGDGPTSPDGFTQGVSDFNPFDKVYLYVQSNRLFSIDALSGEIISNPVLENPNDAVQPFTNIAYNWMEDALYGLAYEYLPPVDPFDFEDFGETQLFLVKANAETGEITYLSESPLSVEPFISGNSDIDPVNRVYYYATADAIYGVDLDTGELLTSAPLTFTEADTQFFVNLTYNWKNGLLYGLHFLSIPNEDPFNTDFTSELRLATIAPNTGEISNVSSTPTSPDGFSQGDCDIDPENDRYFYIRQNALYIVDLMTGEVMDIVPIDNPNNAVAPIINMSVDDFVEMPSDPLIMEANLAMSEGESMVLNGWMGDADVTYTWDDGTQNHLRSIDEAGVYTLTVQKMGLTINATFHVDMAVGLEEKERIDLAIFPNPAQDIIQLNGLEEGMFNYEWIDATGKIVSCGLSQNTQLNVADLPVGIYTLSVLQNEQNWQQQVVVR